MSKVYDVFVYVHVDMLVGLLGDRNSTFIQNINLEIYLWP